MRFLIFAAFAATLAAQPDASPAPWDIRGQATTIMDTHGAFPSPYTGLLSLRPIRETDTSLTSTIFVTYRRRNTEIGFNGELAGGTGFSGVAGIAGFPNGEIPRVAQPTPTPYIARLYVKQKLSRFTWTVGKVAANDFFDNNTYSHDPRTQFENWSIMDNAAWDYPADVRGYTIGAVQEVALGPSIFRIGSFLEPTAANGPNLDRHFAASRGDTFEWQLNYSEGGAIRALAFVNHANMGVYRESATDITTTRRPDRIKYGFGLNAEHTLTANAGVFARLGWNDGKTESWAFTEVDRTASGGVSLKGACWRRPHDVFGAAAAVNGISGDHRAYLARGGAGFIIGDGRLVHAGPETIFETYYAWRVVKFFTLSPDFQYIVNPAYNRDRGPVRVFSLRAHLDL